MSMPIPMQDTGSHAAVELASFLAASYVWVAVSSSRENNPLRTPLLRFAAVVAGWAAINCLGQFPVLWDMKVVLARVASVGWIWIGWLSLDLAYTLCNRPADLWRRWLALPPIVFTGISLASSMVIQDIEPAWWGYTEIPGPWYLAVLVSVLFPQVGRMLHVLLTEIRNPSHPDTGSFAKEMLIAASLLAGLGVLSDVVLPYLDVQLYPQIATSCAMVFSMLVYRRFYRMATRSLSLSQAAGQLFEHLKDGLLLLDHEGSVVLSNQAGLELLGIQSNRSVEGISLDTLLPGFIATELYESLPFSLVTREGVERTLAVSLYPHRHLGMPAGKIVVLRDITDLTMVHKALDAEREEGSDILGAERAVALRRAERAVREREDYLRTLMDNLPFRVWAKDGSGVFTLQNREDREYRGNLAGLSLEESGFNLDTVQAWQKDDARVLSGEVVRSEYSQDSEQGFHYFRSIQVPVRSSGSINGIMGINIDITQEKHAEQERLEFKERLSHSNKMESIGNLAGGIAHDFNNILGALTGYIELSMETTESNHPSQKYMAEALTAAERAKQLVEQILLFSRGNSAAKGAVPVGKVIRETIGLLRTSLPKGISIHVDQPEQDIEAWGDIISLHRILTNLCSNALHAMRKNGGLLQISLCRSNPAMPPQEKPALPTGDWIILEVSDTGHGIPPESLGRIFDPFFTTKKPNEGTGLGLSVVLGIVESLEGQIRVESTVGKGTRFRVYLRPPLQDHADSPAIPTAMDRSVLCLGKEQSTLAVVTEILAALDASIETHEDERTFLTSANLGMHAIWILPGDTLNKLSSRNQLHPSQSPSLVILLGNQDSSVHLPWKTTNIHWIGKPVDRQALVAILNGEDSPWHAS